MLHGTIFLVCQRPLAPSGHQHRGADLGRRALRWRGSSRRVRVRRTRALIGLVAASDKRSTELMPLLGPAFGSPVRTGVLRSRPRSGPKSVVRRRAPLATPPE